MTKIGRNDPCPCGSGQKYKNCCIEKECSTETISSDILKNIKLIKEITIDIPNDILDNTHYDFDIKNESYQEWEKLKLYSETRYKEINNILRLSG